MTATNHALSGALIGAILPLPVAIPAAFMSHFVLDKIPHYGIDDAKRNSSKVYKAVVFGDVILALAIGVAAVLYHKWSMLAGGVAAYSPDATLVRYYFQNGHSFNIQPKNGFMKFHLAMQYERPWGIIPEAALAAVMLPFVILKLIN